MASLLKNTFTLTFYTIFLSSLSYPSHGAFSNELHEGIPTKQMEKTTHLHFFFHDIHSGKTPSAIKIAGSSSPSLFGWTYIIDNALTEGKNASSKAVGRAQGMYAIVAQKEVTLMMMMMMIFDFGQGEFNGSSISVLGRNPTLADEREIPIVGGSGRFRYASGYVVAHTVWVDFKKQDAIVEYNVYVRHY